MNQNNRELEIKIAVTNMKVLEDTIRAQGGILTQDFLLERNLRFDDPARSLKHSHQVLRLRDNGGEAILTYKAGRKTGTGIADREEIETRVENFENTRLILERLGYEICWVYEKYRAVYRLGECEFMLDRTPIGNYIEIEGPNPESIRAAAESLDLNWEQHSDKSYSRLFKEWKEQTDWHGRDMVFSEIGEKQA